MLLKVYKNSLIHSYKSVGFWVLFAVTFFILTMIGLMLGMNTEFKGASYQELFLDSVYSKILSFSFIVPICFTIISSNSLNLNEFPYILTKPFSRDSFILVKILSSFTLTLPLLIYAIIINCIDYSFIDYSIPPVAGEVVIPYVNLLGLTCLNIIILSICGNFIGSTWKIYLKESFVVLIVLGLIAVMCIPEVASYKFFAESVLGHGPRLSMIEYGNCLIFLSAIIFSQIAFFCFWEKKNIKI